MTFRYIMTGDSAVCMGVNPVTYEPDMYHPILEMNSSYSSIKQPILEWLVDNYGNSCSTGFDGDCYYIDFPTKADFAWFKLRWL